MLRSIFTTLLIALTAITIKSQDLNSFKESLTSPSLEGGEVTINESSEARISLGKISQQQQKTGFLGYRIGIFFDNSPSARASAQEAKELAESKFPETNVYMVYENPYFKVSLGDCLSQEEAVVLLNKIQRVFPKAYIMREQMLYENIIIKDKPVVDTLITLTPEEIE